MSGTLLQQNDHRRSAVKEFSFFLTLPETSRLFIIVDLAYHHGAHFHLCDFSEMIGFHDGVFSAILHEYWKAPQRNGRYGVQFAFDIDVFPLYAAVKIAVAVVIVHAEAKYEANAILIYSSQLIVHEEIPDGVIAPFDAANEIVRDPIGGEPCIAGRDQTVRRHIHRTALREDLSCEKIIKATVFGRLIFRKINMIAPDESFDMHLGKTAA